MAGPVAMPVKSLLRYSLQASMRKLAETRPLAPQPADIDRFLSLCHRRRYPSKAPIIRPGDVANTLYYIIEGSLAVMTEDDEGRELILAYVNEGDYIGEMGLFMEVEKREVMVRSRVPCELAEISYERLFQLFEGPLKDECPRILFPFARQIVAECTRNGGFPPLMIDPIDFAAMFQQRMAEEQAKAKVQATS